jgi:hypothetical protein
LSLASHGSDGTTIQSGNRYSGLPHALSGISCASIDSCLALGNIHLKSENVAPPRKGWRHRNTTHEQMDSWEEKTSGPEHEQKGCDITVLRSFNCSRSMIGGSWRHQSPARANAATVLERAPSRPLQPSPPSSSGGSGICSSSRRRMLPPASSVSDASRTGTGAISPNGSLQSGRPGGRDLQRRLLNRRTPDPSLSAPIYAGETY